MRALLFVFACGCDLVFPIGDGAPVGDAGIEGDGAVPAACTAGPPVFAGPATLISANNCIDYTISTAARIAVAKCGGMVEGPLDSAALTPSTFTPEDTSVSLGDPRLSPAGDELFVSASEPSGAQSLRVYRRMDTAWVLDAGGATGFPTVALSTEELATSPPSSGDAGRVVVVETRIADVTTFTEYTDDGNGWSAGDAYTVGDFNVRDMKHPSLTPDGRRLVFAGLSVDGTTRSVYYSERATNDVRFPSATPLATPFPMPAHPHLTAQCDRLYVVNILTANFLAR